MHAAGQIFLRRLRMLSHRGGILLAIPVDTGISQSSDGASLHCGARAVSVAIADLCLVRLYASARKLHFIFRWDYFRTPQDALNTACWFATWAHWEGDLIQHRVTELFIEATVHDHSRIFRSSPSSILR